MDATRIRDGFPVVLKRVRPSCSPWEIENNTVLLSKTFTQDPSNHCVPVYEVLSPPTEDDAFFLVMPALSPCNSPPFETIGEAVDFFTQVFEVRCPLASTTRPVLNSQ
jgi:hypothetical protein